MHDAHRSDSEACWESFAQADGGLPPLVTEQIFFCEVGRGTRRTAPVIFCATHRSCEIVRRKAIAQSEALLGSGWCTPRERVYIWLSLPTEWPPNYPSVAWNLVRGAVGEVWLRPKQRLHGLSSLRLDHATYSSSDTDFSQLQLKLRSTYADLHGRFQQTKWICAEPFGFKTHA